MMPWSFTPFTRNMVTGVFVRLSVLRNMSWRLLTLSAISHSPYWPAASRCGSGRRRAISFQGRTRQQPLLVIVSTGVADAERLQLPVKRRPLHADERRGARDVAGKAADLDLQIFPLERLARLAQRGAHDRLHRLARAE